MNSKTRAHIAVLSANLFFAVNYSLIKLISPSHAGPLAVNVLRIAFSLVIFWILWALGNTKAGFQKKDLGRFLLCGLTGVALNQVLFIKGLILTTIIHVSLLILLTPIVVSLFAFWFLKERMTTFKALGLALGIGGSVLLILQKESGQAAPNYLLGDILILLNAFFYAIYFILVKPLMKHYTPLHVIRWVFTIGFFMVLPVGWKETMQIHWSSFEWTHWLALFFVVFTGTFLAYYFNAYGIRHLGAGTTGTYIYTQPVFAVLIAWLFMGEVLTWPKLLAGLLIFSGVYLVSFRKKEQASQL